MAYSLGLDDRRHAFEAANRGATFLDQFSPGWADKIDLGNLQMASGSFCVLGQLFGDYERGCLRMWGTCNPAPEHGFQLDYKVRSFPLLHEAWVPLILHRQAHAKEERQRAWLEKFKAEIEAAQPAHEEKPELVDA